MATQWGAEPMEFNRAGYQYVVRYCGQRHQERSTCTDCRAIKEAAEARRKANPIGKDFRAWIIARDGGRCLTCGTMEHLTVDHILPILRGGKTDPDNLQTLCRTCNSRKGARV